MTDILAVSRLNKQFNTRPVICDLSFSLKPGERLALLAPSGAGKSSLINLLSKVDTSYTGSGWRYAALHRPRATTHTSFPVG